MARLVVPALQAPILERAGAGQAGVGIGVADQRGVNLRDVSGGARCVCLVRPSHSNPLAFHLRRATGPMNDAAGTALAGTQQKEPPLVERDYETRAEMRVRHSELKSISERLDGVAAVS